MDTPNFDLTKQALEDLSQSMQALRVALDSRKTALYQQRAAYQNNISAKDSQINGLKQALINASEKISDFAVQIDEVLSENGSSDNSN